MHRKDIHKYNYTYEKIWLIFTRRSVDIKLMLDIEKYLMQFYSQLKPKDNQTEIDGRKVGNYNWFEIQDNITYFKDFEKEKMVWGLISGLWGFAYDNVGYFLTSASAFLTSEKIPLKFLLALFNSRLFQFYFDKTGEYTAGGAYVLKKKNIEKFIIPTKEMDYTPYIDWVDKILAAKEQKQDTAYFEKTLNKMVYQLYDISEIEQAEIETILIKRKIK